MYSDSNRSTHTRHLIAFGGTVVLGIAIGMAHSLAQPQDKAQKSGAPAKPAADAAPAADGGATRAGEAAKRRAGRLGFQLDENAEGVLSVRSVDESGAAAQAAFRQRDRIVSVDGYSVTSGRQLQAYLMGQAGRRVPVVIERDGRQYTIQVTPPRSNEDGAWLGVYLQEPGSESRGEKGARIMQIYPTGPAARAGLEPGDLIRQIDGQPVDGPAELIGLIDDMKPQSRVEFAIQRGEQNLKVPVTLGSRNSFMLRDYNRGDDRDDERQGPAGDDGFDVPPHVMQLEHDRRMAEQHERIERELAALREEIARLREDLKKK